MTASYLTHPLATFVAGAVVTFGGIVWLVAYSAQENRSAEFVAAYKQAQAKTPDTVWNTGSPEEVAALDRFKTFLKRVGDAGFVKENTRRVYAAEAFLDDTLVVHHGAAAIEKYFLKTAETMSGFEVSIDDVSRSGANYYVRWTMIFSAPLLSGGKSVHSVGISHVRFDSEGKVILHQDFWDSGKNFYAHLPVVGGVIGFIRKRLG